MSDYKYPDDLIKKTDARIQAQLVGNGTEKLPLTIKRQGMDKFSAHTDYTIDCKSTSKEQAGKVTSGEVVPHENLKSAVENFINGIQSNKSTNATMCKQIESLPVKGFGAEKAHVKLKGQSQTYISHKQCGSCMGKGQSECRQCQGQGREKCPLCLYTGELNCMTCQGRGMVNDANNGQKPCTNCHGRGRVYCTNCNGQKTVSCNACQAKGHIVCKTCQGKGESSLITTVTATAITDAKINIQELDSEPKVMVSKAGALNLAKGGHINIQLIKPPSPNETDDTAWYENKPKSTEVTGVFYEAQVPWAVGEVTYKDKPYNISMVGKKGAVCDSANFMDAVLKKPMDIMETAANGQGIVSSLLKDACEYRVSRETLTSVIKGKTKQTMVELHRTYGIGLSKPFIQNFVKSTYLASKKITRRPRYIGLGLGLTIIAILNYYWFMMDGRPAPANINDQTQYIFDGLILLVGLGVIYGMIKGAAYIAMQSVLKTLGISVKKIPAAGVAGIYGLIGCTVIWGVLFGMMFI